MSKRNMGTLPEKWGFIDSLKDCIGKTIEAAETVKMPYGCTWNSAWAVRFTDGSRAFFVGGTGSGIVDPEYEGVQSCSIFTADEVGQYAAREAARSRQRELDNIESKRRQLAALQRELGQKGIQ